MKLVKQSLVLILSFLFIYVWQNTLLSLYTIPVLGALVFLYLLLAARKKGRGFLTMGGEGKSGIFILTTLILLLIFSTGGLSSPIFFLLYFLGFGIAFVFDPLVIFVFVLGVILVFLQLALKDDVMGNFLRLGSLLLISPLAFFFANEYRKGDKQEDEIEKMQERAKDAADTISEDVEEVIDEEKEHLDQKATDKLNEILEETEDLRKETKK